MDQLNFSDVVALTFCFLAILALAVYEWRTRAPSRGRMLPDSELPEGVAHAVRDCTREYISVRILGYTHADARSHLRAYIKAKHSFLPDVQSSIQRETLTKAREHEQRFPTYTI